MSEPTNKRAELLSRYYDQATELVDIVCKGEEATEDEQELHREICESLADAYGDGVEDSRLANSLLTGVADRLEQLADRVVAPTLTSLPLSSRYTVASLESQYPPSDDPLVRLCHVLDIKPGEDIERVLQEAADLMLEVALARQVNRAPKGQVLVPVSPEEAAERMVEHLRDPLVDPRALDVCLPRPLQGRRPHPVVVVHRAGELVFAASHTSPIVLLTVEQWQKLMDGGQSVDRAVFWSMQLVPVSEQAANGTPVEVPDAG